MIKTFPIKLPNLPDEAYRFQRNITLSGGSTTLIVKPEGIEPFKLERINGLIPGFKITDTLPAGFLFPNIKIQSQSGYIYTPDFISMRAFMSPMASQQWTGGVRVNAHAYNNEGLRIFINNYDPAVTPNIRLLFIGKRRLQHSGYTNAVE